MSPRANTDRLVVIDGPEDGTQFPIVRTPLYAGSDAGCQANLRLDTAIHPYHAIVTAVSGGYRVRSAKGYPVYVNGKRAGIVRSRILRPGGELRVGHTTLTVDLAPDGLARRTRQALHDSDLGWAIRKFSTLLGKNTWSWAKGMGYTLGQAATNWKFIALAAGLGYVFYPPFQRFVNSVLLHIHYRTTYPLSQQIMNLFD